MSESSEHLAGRIMRERHLLARRQGRFAKITDTGYDFTRNVGEFVYELPTGERFEVQIRAWTEVLDADDPPEYDPDDAEAQRIAETCADANREYDRIEVARVKPLRLFALMAVMGTTSGAISYLLSATVGVMAEWIWFPVSFLLAIAIGILAAERRWLE